jgi:hypothetical protein
MRFEGDGNCLGLLLPRSSHDFAQDMGMSSMHAIEIPNAHQRRSKTCRDIIQFVKYLH